jgi:hypothetical protein
MSIKDECPILPRGLLRVRVAITEFQQLIKDADVILAADVRNPLNTSVVFLDPRLHNDHFQDEGRAEILTVPVDSNTDDANVLGELCNMLRGHEALIDDPRSN